MGRLRNSGWFARIHYTRHCGFRHRRGRNRLWILRRELGSRGDENRVTSAAQAHSRPLYYRPCAPNLEIFRRIRRERCRMPLY
jgi:hypothetical protein